MDSSGKPFALIIAEDIRQVANCASSLKYAILPPAIVVGCKVEMQTLVGSDDFTLFDVGARGAVVMGDKGVVGVLTSDAVTDYLGSADYRPSGKTRGTGESPRAGDAVLGGDFQTPVGRVRCRRCDFINQVHFLDRRNPPLCQNTQEAHTLVLS